MNTIRAAWTILVVSALSVAIASISGCNHATADDAQILRQIAALSVQIEQLQAEINAQNVASEPECDLQAFLDGDCDENPASTSATFCFSQSLGGELSGGYAIEGNINVEAGARWDVAALASLNYSITAPVPTALGVNPLPPFLPIPGPPLPTSVGIGLAGGLGRNFDICVDVPIQLGPDRTMQLDELTRDINGAYQSLFTRRAERVIQFGHRKKQDRLEQADAAIENIINNGFADTASSLELFSEGNVLDLLDSLPIPDGIRNTLSDPASAYGSLREVSLADATCASLGLDQAVRDRNPAVENLCTRLENLPSSDSFERIAPRVERLNERIRGAIPTRANMRGFCDYVSLRVGTGSNCRDQFPAP
jgi:hypothetical protein